MAFLVILSQILNLFSKLIINRRFELFVVTSWHIKIPSFWETIYSLYALLKVVSGISLHPVHFIDGKGITGILNAIGMYEIFLQVTNKTGEKIAITVFKNAIKYINWKNMK